MKTYTKRPYSIAQYTQMRGTIDFTNAAQFNLFESGYSFLTVISRPRYIEKLAESDSEVSKALDLFCWILEYEFRGLDGIDNVTSDPLEFTDNISTINTVGKVIAPSAEELTMQFTERSGGAMTGFIEYYLTGLKDPRTQAKTYHGLIANGKLAAGFENEVFNLLYIVTDNTMLSLEKAYLLANAWPNAAPTGSLYNSEKGAIEKKDIDVVWNCFLLASEEINKRAVKMLAYINETAAVANYTAINGSNAESIAAAKSVTKYASEQAKLNSDEYQYSALKSIDKIYQ